MHTELLLKILYNKKGYINSKRISKIKDYPNIYSYISSYYNDSTSLQETLTRMKQSIDIHPLCPVCGKPLIFIGRYNKLFSKYCSTKCKGISDERKSKYKKTCNERYGVDTPLASKELREIGKKTCIDKYGVDHPFRSEKIQQKYRETCANKYGVDWNSKTIEWKMAMKEIISSDYIQEKRYNTMKEHKSFNTSKDEEELYLYIKERFPDVKRQYKDKERYPYFCDFYIPSKDLFIEYNGHQSHGRHPFDPNSKEDKKKIEEWNKKYENGLHPMYMNMILTWTNRDVKKRKHAQNKNLNYKEIWSIEEGKECINSLLDNF